MSGTGSNETECNILIGGLCCENVLIYISTRTFSFITICQTGIWDGALGRVIFFVEAGLIKQMICLSNCSISVISLGSIGARLLGGWEDAPPSSIGYAVLFQYFSSLIFFHIGSTEGQCCTSSNPVIGESYRQYRCCPSCLPPYLKSCWSYGIYTQLVYGTRYLCQHTSALAPMILTWNSGKSFALYGHVPHPYSTLLLPLWSRGL